MKANVPKIDDFFFVNRLESVLEGMVKIGAEGSSRLQEQE